MSLSSTTGAGGTAYDRGNGPAGGNVGVGSGALGTPRRTRMGAIEFLLYNMASMLAGVAAGYDVRLSNVSPIHPKLHPMRLVRLLPFYSCVHLNFAFIPFE